MNPESQRIAIAQACGWRMGSALPDGTPCWQGRQCDEFAVGVNQLPDYLNDLNAMNEAEKMLPSAQHYCFVTELNKVVFGDDGKSTWPPMFEIVSATPVQRAQAFLRTLNLWK